MQLVDQLFGAGKQPPPHPGGGQLRVGGIADRLADGMAGGGGEGADGDRARPDDGGMRGVVVRVDEAGLSIAQSSVAHGDDGEVDAILGQQGDTIGRGDGDEGRRYAELLGDAFRDRNLKPRGAIAVEEAEWRVVVEHADAERSGARVGRQPVGGSRAGPGGLAIGLGQDGRERRIGVTSADAAMAS